jgi:hypothetical protein
MFPSAKSHAKTDFCILLLLTALALGVSGYHPGIEDDGVYLPAIKKDLNPALYPHDSDFFTVQLQATVFDKIVAESVRITHVPLDAALLGWQFLSIFLILWGCLQISRRCFVGEACAQWASVTLVAVLLTLPVAGSALYLVDQYLHPRALATAAVLAGIAAILDKKYLLAAAFLAVAFALHPLMASFGISFCALLLLDPLFGERPKIPVAAAFLMLPLGWVFEPTSPAWEQAAQLHDYFYLSRWHWYEWLGVFAPVLLLWWFRHLALRARARVLARMSERLVLYSCLQFAVAVVVLSVPSLDRLRPMQPMRYLHLLYFLFVLFAGGFIGRYILRGHWWRWLLFFIPLAAGMFIAQRQLYPATRHLEWPGVSSENAWVGAFLWVRQNTPQDSRFALDPYYMARPGEDFHSFRALAERSAMADYVKDSSVVTQVPHLADRWQKEVTAEQGWEHFQAEDFERLKNDFGVDWIVLELPKNELPKNEAGTPGGVVDKIDNRYCPYQNRAMRVCQVK